METETIIGLVVGLAIGAFILVVFGLILQWLWNSTLPEVLGVNQVTTWQAIKIMFIASMLSRPSRLDFQKMTPNGFSVTAFSRR